MNVTNSVALYSIYLIFPKEKLFLRHHFNY